MPHKTNPCRCAGQWKAKDSDTIFCLVAWTKWTHKLKGENNEVNGIILNVHHNTVALIDETINVMSYITCLKSASVEIWMEYYLSCLFVTKLKYLIYKDIFDYNL